MLVLLIGRTFGLVETGEHVCDVLFDAIFEVVEGSHVPAARMRR